MSIHETVLIIGATSGIGAALARHIHAQNKTVIATGRRQDRLSSLASSHPGLQTASFDISDIATLPSNLSALATKYPAIDTVIINAGMQSFFKFSDADTPSPEEIAMEVTTNITAPMIACQSIVPFFLKQEKLCSFIFVGGGLGYIPLPYFPVYCPTKAALQSLAVSLRAQLSETNVSVTVVNPPWVATDLDAAFKDKLIEMLGGPEKAPPQMPLEEFVEEAMKELDSLGEDGKPKKDVGVGAFPVKVVETWRKSFDPFLEQFHVDG
ncbi:putative NADP(+)-dependent dehydrogenase [Cadophora sp. DSE1049]|nr:putative NADP(+)-dependent dehydrogenase [Cadophora sp. DSE1049]